MDKKKFVIGYILVFYSVIAITVSLLTCDTKIKMSFEVASKKLDAARISKSEEDIKEADKLIDEVYDDKRKETLKSDLNNLKEDIDRESIKEKYTSILTELKKSLDENKLKTVKEEINSLKYKDLKEEFNKEIKSIEESITKKKAEEEAARKKAEEEKKKQEAAAKKAAEQAAWKKQWEANKAKADRTIPNTTPPKNIKVLESYKGTISAYSDTHTAAGISVAGGNIFYKDKTYGQVYIVAADKQYPFGTIVRFRNMSYFGGRDIYAIVLDRGGMIKKGYRDFDLLFALKSSTSKFGLRKNVTCEILRKGY